MTKKLMNKYMNNYELNLKKLILYQEPRLKYNLDVMIKTPEYIIGYDRNCNIFFKQYNLYFDLIPDIQNIIINFLHLDDNIYKKYNLIKRIREIKRNRENIKNLILQAKGKLRY